MTRYTYSTCKTVRCYTMPGVMIRVAQVRRGNGKWRLYGTIWEDETKPGGDTLRGLLDKIAGEG